MNAKALKILGASVLGLVAVLVILEMRDESTTSSGGDLLFPDLKEKINNVTHVKIVRGGGTEPITIDRSSGTWSIESRDGYPADVSKIRTLLLAIADARITEEKTSNPDLHSRLGLLDPDNESSDSVLVSVSGDKVSAEAIFGNVAQSTHRYVRRYGESGTWLIDQNPDIPVNTGDWLIDDLIDIEQSDIRQVTISHTNGDTIHISRESADEPDFGVSDIPSERELSYATVANGIANALNDLKLEDVRRIAESDTTVSTRFETFDGLIVTANVVESGDDSWVGFTATTARADGQQAESINRRTDGWQFRIADFKANLLTRKWEDILKTESE